MVPVTIQTLCFLVMSLFLFSCQSSEIKVGANTVKQENSVTNIPSIMKTSVAKKVEFKMMWMQGRVQFLDFEGGFYGIITDDGKKLLPMNLKAEYHQLGAVIQFKGYVMKDVVTIQQWGTPFKIAEIKLLKAGKRVGNENDL